MLRRETEPESERGHQATSERLTLHKDLKFITQVYEKRGA